MRETVDSREEYEVQYGRKHQRAEQYLTELNDCIRQHSQEGITRYLSYYNQKEFLEEYKAVRQEFEYGHVIAVITVNEWNRGIRPLFMDQGDTLQELITIIKQIQFALWEVMFSCGEDAEERFYQRMKKYSLSVEALKVCLSCWATDVKMAYGNVVCICLDHGEYVLAVRLLQAALELYPKDSEFTAVLQQLSARLDIDVQL